MSEAPDFASDPELLHELRSHWPPSARACLIAADYIEKLKAGSDGHMQQAFENGAAANRYRDEVERLKNELQAARHFSGLSLRAHQDEVKRLDTEIDRLKSELIASREFGRFYKSAYETVAESEKSYVADHERLRAENERLNEIAAKQQRLRMAQLEQRAIDLPGFVKPDTIARVHFYEQEFYVLSNFSAFSVKMGEAWMFQKFRTSEHAYHWAKFPPITRDESGLYVRDEILRANSAHAAFKLAEKWKHLRRADWDDVKLDKMREILRAKVDQHEYVRRKLLETGDRELVEDSWRDPYWGWGPQRDGLNMLGKLWMEIRAELRGEAGVRPSPLRAEEIESQLCEDCPPVGYPTDETRCAECPRRAEIEAQANRVE